MLAMITTATDRPWPGDTGLADHEAAGLHLPCTVRLKIFTLDNRLILRRIGDLSASDRKRVSEQVRSYLF